MVKLSIKTNPLNRLLLLFLSLLFISSAGLAQKVLVLEHAKRAKRIRYYDGDQIFIRYGVEKMKIKGELRLYTDSIIYVENNKVPLDSIHSINIKKHNVLAWLGKDLGIKGAILYSIISGVNTLATNDYSMLRRSTVYVVPAGLALAGGIMLIEKNWFRLDEKRTVSVKDHSPM